jgi:alcohol dehydrogenase (cytochrome c)
MVLTDRDYQGRTRKLLVTANRNGFYYVLDRVTGEFLHAQPFVKQTWAKEIGRDGRPVVLPGKDPTPEGNEVWPSTTGGTNWWSPSYSPLTAMLYVPVLERSSFYYSGEAVYRPGMLYEGGTGRGNPEGVAGFIRALDVLTGEKRWEYKLESVPRSGVLATAGGVVIGAGVNGKILALDAGTGRELWTLNLGGAIVAGPISYLSKGRQHLAIAAGSGIFVFALPE